MRFKYQDKINKLNSSKKSLLVNIRKKILIKKFELKKN